MTKQKLRNFGLMMGSFVGILFGLLLPYLFSHGIPMWPWIVLGVFFFFALLLPYFLFPIYKGWMVIGHWLGWVNTRIILGILFYLVFFPMGVFMKLLGKDPMMRKLKRNEETSYRETCSPKNIELMKEPY
jgi:hypothetical protein